MADDAGADPGAAEAALIELAVEGWRLARGLARLLDRIEPAEAGRYQAQLRYFQRRVEEQLAGIGLSLVNLEGQSFDTGMAAAALNLGDFGPDEALQVEQMLEPVVMGPTGLRRQGTVMLGRAKS
jgi:hypothetical protein